MTATELLAVDIVLLPPAEVSRRAIAASRRLASALRLGPGRLPHLTLAMACIESDALPAVAALLRAIASRRPALEITLEGTIGVPGPAHVSVWYAARRTRALMALHRDCMKALSPHRRKRVPAAAFAAAPGEPVSPSALRWVRRFEEEAAFERYRPHITLGYGRPGPDSAFPSTFPGRRLALCHLGNHCTCVRILTEARLAASGVN